LVSLESIIQQKQSGGILSNTNIQYIVNGYTSGLISDDEMTAWLNAVFQNGMSHEETLDYTRAMVNSGVTLNFSHLPGFVLDKHSTGGVGDKVSLVLGPLLAVCGCYIPMLAGRGLAHTGGTIDKLESIPGYKTALSLTEFQNIVETVGVSIMEQTEEICPADRKIYALRDVTNTVASNPLICGSIMSKKIAEGIKGLVLDIKVGNGAFMKTLSQAKELGKLLKEVGELYGLKVLPCFTDMNQPLGNSAGLWCEVRESMECLQGNGPEDLMAVVYHLGKSALEIAGIENPEEKLKSNIENGKALEKFNEMVDAHGGAFESIADSSIHAPKYKKIIIAKDDGFITHLNTLEFGKAVVQLGGGRLAIGDKLDYSTGIQFNKKIGQTILKGETLAEVFCSNQEKLEIGYSLVGNAYYLRKNSPKVLDLIY
jgi:pyrimidine-nucleoside phosphorylase